MRCLSVHFLARCPPLASNASAMVPRRSTARTARTFDGGREKRLASEIQDEGVGALASERSTGGHRRWYGVQLGLSPLGSRTPRAEPWHGQRNQLITNNAQVLAIFAHAHIHVSDPSTSPEMWGPLGGAPNSSAHAKNLLRKSAMPAHPPNPEFIEPPAYLCRLSRSLPHPLHLHAL